MTALIVKPYHKAKLTKTVKALHEALKFGISHKRDSVKLASLRCGL